jgi:hypothetical protein
MKFEEIQKNAIANGVPAGAMQLICGFVQETGDIGIEYETVIKRITEGFSMTIEECKALIYNMMDPEDGILKYDEDTGQNLVFMEPLYLEFFRFRGRTAKKWTWFERREFLKRYQETVKRNNR